jgi:DAK2 domain fusion protein YloV
LVDRLEAADLVGLVNGAIEALKIHKEEINAMNVFPVPDGDTGTNMLLTMQAVKEAIGKSNHLDMPSVCQAISRGSLMGARGNSGVVLSQILKGMTEVFSREEAVDVTAMSEALSRGSEVAYRAVMKPVEGTILTVVREAADEGMRTKEEHESINDWFAGVAYKARETLEQTPELLPVLKEAGVVDAGGRGLLAIFEGIIAHLSGEVAGTVEEEIGQVTPLVHSQIEDYRYEAQFMLDCKDAKADELREALNELGGSVLVVGSEKLYRVHVHTDLLGKVMEEASGAGQMSDVEITDLKLQAEEAAASAREASGKRIGVVAVAVGDGIKEVLLSMGVDRIVDGGQSMNPSTAEMLDAVNGLPQDQVLLIPNNKNIVPAAQQVGELTAKEVIVIPATAITEGFASMVAFDSRQELEFNSQRMLEALGNIKTGAVTTAVRDSRHGAIKIKKGQYIGLFRGGIVAASKSAVDTGRALVEAMLEEGDELACVIIGGDARDEHHHGLTDLLEDRGLEVEIIDGGQPVYQYIIGLE